MSSLRPPSSGRTALIRLSTAAIARRRPRPRRDGSGTVRSRSTPTCPSARGPARRLQSSPSTSPPPPPTTAPLRFARSRSAGRWPSPSSTPPTSRPPATPLTARLCHRATPGTAFTTLSLPPLPPRPDVGHVRSLPHRYALHRCPRTGVRRGIIGAPPHLDASQEFAAGGAQSRPRRAPR